MNSPTQTADERREVIENILATSNGTDDYHRGAFGAIKYTDGVALIADAGRAFWLIDAIASYQATLRKRADWEAIDRMAIWRLDVFNLPTSTPPSERWLEGYRRSFHVDFGNEVGDASALLSMRLDTDTPNLVEQWIPYTDFPCFEIELWTSNGVLLCPREN
jgi:hypothetical protein